MYSLKKLDHDDIHHIKGRSIYFVGCFISYFSEIYSKYPKLPMASGVFDEDSSKFGITKYGDTEIPVMPYEEISSVDHPSVFIITTGYYRNAFNAIINSLPVDYVYQTVFYFPNLDTEYYEYYLEKYKNDDLRNIIVFRSGMGTWEHVPGMDYTDNARALYEYMVSNGFENKFEMVWLVDDPGQYKSIDSEKNQTHFISYYWATSSDEDKRSEYYKVICLAKYFFFTHAYGFCRFARPEQVRVQLWHGCGIKTVNNTVPMEDKYEYMTVTSEKYADIHQKEFGLRKDQLLVTGLAKEDWLFHPQSGWEEQLSLPDADKYVFWLPTYRQANDSLKRMNAAISVSETGLPVIRTFEDMNRINRILKNNNAVLLIKLHPLQKKNSVFIGDNSNIVLVDNMNLAAEDLHINQLLGDAAALISDYSSVAIDYLLLDRPLAFAIDDVDEYKKERGFVMEPIDDWLPGEKLYNTGDFMTFLENVFSGNDSSYALRKKLTGVLHENGDDRNCERIVKALGIEK